MEDQGTSKDHFLPQSSASRELECRDQGLTCAPKKLRGLLTKKRVTGAFAVVRTWPVELGSYRTNYPTERKAGIASN